MTAIGLLGWLKENLLKLPSLISSVSEFSALASAAHLGRLLSDASVDGVLEKEFTEDCTPCFLGDAPPTKKNGEELHEALLVQIWALRVCVHGEGPEPGEITSSTSPGSRCFFLFSYI